MDGIETDASTYVWTGGNPGLIQSYLPKAVEAALEEVDLRMQVRRGADCITCSHGLHAPLLPVRR